MQKGPTMSHDPVGRFKRWYRDAVRAGIRQPEAMALATATPEGVPSLRMVLLKRVEPDAIVFFTDARSRKGTELAVNPRAAALFYWEPLGRQVRLEGPVSPLSAQESDAYWESRARESQLSGATSHQSAPIGSRQELKARRDELARRLAGKPVPRPEAWGGYRIRIDAIEFWSAREGRFHQREEFVRRRQGWVRRLLQP
jgi:pyridoxamine 5'-phosphate oxidase